MVDIIKRQFGYIWQKPSSTSGTKLRLGPFLPSWLGPFRLWIQGMLVCPKMGQRRTKGRKEKVKEERKEGAMEGAMEKCILLGILLLTWTPAFFR